MLAMRHARRTAGAALLMLTASTALAQDRDHDGVADPEDNCTGVQNALQCDSDFDGYGNACDGDYDQNDAVDSIDRKRWLSDLEFGENSGIGTDSDCDGAVHRRDYHAFLARYRAGIPGPSGLSCAGTVPCGDGDGSQPDPEYVVHVAQPAYPRGGGPVVLIDQTHQNLGTLRRGSEPGLFSPFAELLEADGYTVEALEGGFDRAALDAATILVVADPHADFSEAELDDLRDFFNRGSGVLVLIERPDLVPKLVARLEIDFTERRLIQVPPNCPGALPGCPSAWNTFRRDDRSLTVARRESNGREHFEESVDSVLAFDSYGLIIDPVLFPRYRNVLTFGPTATYRASSPNGSRTVEADGLPFALSLDYGKQDRYPYLDTGRLFVATNFEMFTALTRPRSPSGDVEPIGFQIAGAEENVQFVLNVVHELDRGLDPGPFADHGFYVPAVRDPEYAPGAGPRIFYDHRHDNKKILVAGVCPATICAFETFHRLIEADGYDVAATTASWVDLAAQLSSSDIVVSVYPRRNAYVSDAEAAAILDWVRGGGSLFVILDWQPGIGTLAARLGLELAGAVAYVYPTREDAAWCPYFFQNRTPIFPSWLCLAVGPGQFIEFSVDRMHAFEGLIARTHPITRGRNPREEVRRVRITKGNHLRVSSPQPGVSYVSHLTLPTLPQSGSDYTIRLNLSGWSHAMAIELGAGRIYLYGDEGSLTGSRIHGLSDPLSEDNVQLVLNVLHWLDGTL